MQTKPLPESLVQLILSDSFQIRFWNKVKIKGPRECWPWTASFANGYGQMGIWHKKKRHHIRSHKLAWIIQNSCDVPPLGLVLHSLKCSKSCCNPHHLRIGDKHENAVDMVKQGRSPRSKFTERQVKSVRREFSNGKTLSELSRTHKCTLQNIRAIVLRKTWTHV